MDYPSIESIIRIQRDANYPLLRNGPVKFVEENICMLTTTSF